MIMLELKEYPLSFGDGLISVNVTRKSERDVGERSEFESAGVGSLGSQTAHKISCTLSTSTITDMKPTSEEARMV